MRYHPSLIAVFLILLGKGQADTVSWGPLAQSLSKPGYDETAGEFTIASDDGIDVRFRMHHAGTSPDIYTYSKWEIDRWGDPAGFFLPVGSWQVANNTANAPVLGLWGQWFSEGVGLNPGDATSYVLEIRFEEPVSDLSFPIHGINALIDTYGNNARDRVVVNAFLATSNRQESIAFADVGASVRVSGNVLTADPAVPMGSVTGFYPISDDGSVTVSINDKVDRLEIAVRTEAFHTDPAAFSGGEQNWSISVGDLTFTQALPLDRATLAWEPLRTTLDKPGYTNDSDAIYVYASDDTGIAFDLNFSFTTGDKFSYSQWQIDRWGDPSGTYTLEPGSWQVPSNAFNDVVLAPWGFWGSDGTPGSTTAFGDQTSYQLVLNFAEPVTDLSFALHSIDAALSDAYNTIDRMTVRSYLNGAPAANPVSLGRYGQLPVVDGVIDGEFPESGQTNDVEANSNAGTVDLRFPEPVDQVDLTFTTTAEHPVPSLFSDGAQNWSFSLGDLSFLTGTQTMIDWDPLRTTLFKEPFDNEPGSYSVASQDGEVTATFEIEHLGTTDDKFGYWKWEIDRWGDPDGLSTPEPGAWQIVTNEANDVVFGVWGYWGTDGSAGSPPVAIGDETSYQVSITFDKPVKNLDFDLGGINGFLKPIDGFNSQDIMTIATSLGGVSQGAATYSNEGDAFTREGNVLTGDYGSQIVGVYGGQHVSDQGVISIHLADTIDRVDLTLINRAGHPDPAQYQDGLQTFSFSISDLVFTH